MSKWTTTIRGAETEYRLNGSAWMVLSIMNPHRRRREYRCYRGLELRATKDDLLLATAYCERDGKAYTNKWDVIA